MTNSDTDAQAWISRLVANLHDGLENSASDEVLTIANEFSEAVVAKLHTRNGCRLLVVSPKSGHWITLDALELEALTWQNAATLTAMVGRIQAPLIAGDEA